MLEKKTGFTVVKTSEDVLEVCFNSGSVNGKHHRTYTAPYKYQELIFDAVKEKYGDKF